MVSPQEIVMYGTTWCSDCVRSKKFFEENQVDYVWVDVELDEDGLEYVQQVNGGVRVVPTILFPDGDILVEPSNTELGMKLEAIHSES